MLEKINILIINFHSPSNAGDSALLSAAITQLNKTFQKAKITISSNYPDENTKLIDGQLIKPSFGCLIGAYEHKLLIKKPIMFLLGVILVWIYSRWPWIYNPSSKWRRFLSMYLEADIVIGCPGNQFFSMGNFGWPLWEMSINSWTAVRFNKPLYYMPISIGPFTRKWEEQWIKSILAKSRLLFVRDQISLNLASKIWSFPDEQVKYSPDMAFELQSDDPDIALKILTKWGYSSRKPSLGITLIPRMVKSLSKQSITNYYQAIIESLNNFQDHHDVQIVFFAQSTGPTELEDDRIPAREIVKYLQKRENIIVIDEELANSTLKACYQYMDAFIASRLHSGIFAISVLVPCLFIGYLSKTQGLVNSIGLQEWFIKLDDISPQLLTNSISNLWTNRENIKSQIRTALNCIVNNSQSVSDEIAFDYYGKIENNPNY